MSKLWKKAGSILLLLALFFAVNGMNIQPQIAKNETVVTEKKQNNNNKKESHEELSTSLGDIFKLLFGEDDLELAEDTDTKSDKKEIEYHFRSDKYLTQHFEKHGEEFDYKTKEEYEKGASKVVNDPDALHKLEEEDGDDVYYLEDTNEFVIVSKDGYLRTYFKPSAGKKYFDRQ